MRKVKFAATFAHREKAIKEALNIFTQSNILTKIEAEEDEAEEMQEVVYSLEDEKRLYLEDYKNNILHFFVPLSFVATSMVRSNEDAMSLGRVVGVFNFFKH